MLRNHGKEKYWKEKSLKIVLCQYKKWKCYSNAIFIKNVGLPISSHCQHFSTKDADTSAILRAYVSSKMQIRKDKIVI